MSYKLNHKDNICVSKGLGTVSGEECRRIGSGGFSRDHKMHLIRYSFKRNTIR